jgi:hypothetical protein
MRRLGAHADVNLTDLDRFSNGRRLPARNRTFNSPLSARISLDLPGPGGSDHFSFNLRARLLA